MVEPGRIIETGEEVVVPGCAHPGVVEMVPRAREVLGGAIALVKGQASHGWIEDTRGDFRPIGVRPVTPSHCTVEQALQQFGEAFGADFVRGRLGDVIPMAAPGRWNTGAGRARRM
jgi:7,8-dihydropterin-6-yl-methyl-4-(beta-D-ribofuranosyl)aminobenzene 5'-phosphate synthase